MRWAILATLSLAACNPAGPAVDAATATAATPGPAGAAEEEAAVTDIVLALDEPLTLDGGEALVLTSFVVEQIEAAPGDEGSYPAGAGVVVGVRLAGEDLELSQLSPSPPYTSATVAWSGELRVELVALDDARSTATVRIQRLGDDPVPGWEHRLSLERGKTATLPDGTALRLDGHAHKMVEPDMHSPLITTITLERAGAGPQRQTWNVDPSGAQPWHWQDLVFWLESYGYDTSMVVRVQRRPLKPVGAAAP